LTGPDNQSALRKVPCRKASCDNHGVQMWSNKGLDKQLDDPFGYISTLILVF
jgi:hypothetical protein